MLFNIALDNQLYKIESEFPFNINIFIESDPFHLKCNYMSKMEKRVSPFRVDVYDVETQYEYTNGLNKLLQDIEGYQLHVKTNLILEVRKGGIFLLDKALEDYL